MGFGRELADRLLPNVEGAMRFAAAPFAGGSGHLTPALG
jgi:hypothetical protein